jgi:hypothetical protein
MNNRKQYCCNTGNKTKQKNNQTEYFYYFIKCWHYFLHHKWCFLKRNRFIQRNMWHVEIAGDLCGGDREDFWALPSSVQVGGRRLFGELFFT